MVRRFFDIALTLLLFGPPCIFGYTYTGPFRWLAEAQLALLGSYYGNVTFLLTMVLWAGACMLLYGLAQRLLGKQTPLLAAIRSQDSIVARQLPAMVVVVTLSMLAIAGYYEYRFYTTGAATPVEVAKLGEKFWYAGAYLRIENAVIDSNLAHGTSSSSTPGHDTYYLPLFPSDYQKGQPIRAFVEVPMGRLRDEHLQADKLRTGLVTFSGLPGMTRVAFERQGLPAASGHIVILYGSTPAELQTNAGLFLVFAMLVAGVGSFLWFRIRRQAAEKASAAWGAG